VLCGKCGKNIKEGNLFCTGCGNRVEQDKYEPSDLKLDATQKKSIICYFCGKQQIGAEIFNKFSITDEDKFFCSDCIVLKDNNIAEDKNILETHDDNENLLGKNSCETKETQSSNTITLKLGNIKYVDGKLCACVSRANDESKNIITVLILGILDSEFMFYSLQDFTNDGNKLSEDTSPLVSCGIQKIHYNRSLTLCVSNLESSFEIVVSQEQYDTIKKYLHDNKGKLDNINFILNRSKALEKENETENDDDW